MGSVFDFLKQDYTELYNHCVTSEKLIKDENYRIAILNSGVIAEDLAKRISKRVPQKKKQEYKEIHTQQPDFDRIIEICKSLNLFHHKHNKNQTLAHNYDQLRYFANKARHEEDYPLNLNKARELHKYLFNITLEYYNSYEVEIEPRYYFDLSYLDESNGIDKKEFEYLIDNIKSDTVSKEELQNILNQNEFITKQMLKTLLSEYEDKLINKTEFNEYLESKDNLITEEDVENIVKVYYDKSINKEELKEKLSSFISKNEINNFVSEITKDKLSISDAQKLIEENNTEIIKSVKPIIEDSIRKIISEQIFSIQKEMDKINLIDYDNNGESFIIDIPNYEIIEENDTFYLNEVKEELDDFQKEAVEYKGEKVLVIDAGPGAGKTRVIVERVVYLIKKLGEKPSSLLVITFTNKAADELKERLKRHPELTIEEVNQMRISTIHSFCRYVIQTFEDVPYNFLKRHGERGLFLQKHKYDLGFEKEAFYPDSELIQVSNKYQEYTTFGVITEKLVEYIKNQTSISPKYEEYIENFYQNHDINQNPYYQEIDRLDFKDSLYNARYLQIAESYHDFLDYMEREHVADHDYLLIKANEILEDEEKLGKIPYTNILIDEFQDTDNNQIKLINKLLTIRSTFTIVGDADQSIYGFRGTDPTIFTSWANNENYKVITLKYNYRSTKNIVQFNEKLIEDDRDTEKELSAVNDFKMPVYHMYSQKSLQQARNIIKIIKHLKDENKIKYYSDIGILVRKGVSNENTRAILEQLNEEGIPYYLKGINDLMEQDEVKAILTLIWYLLPQDNFYLRKYEDEWLNLFGFTDDVYNSSKIFKLSKSTRRALKIIKTKYERKVMKKEREIHYRRENKSSKIKEFKGVFKNRSQDVINEIFESVDKPDLSILTKEELIKLGITNQHDLNFFLQLNELKRKHEEDFYSMTTLEIFSKLLNITGYVDELVVRYDNEAKRALMNIGLVSDIISDYENIMGEYNLNGLFKYLSGILNSYSCPINDIEDNTHKVHIMTIHRSKGLEFPVVIVPSLLDDSFPKYFNEDAKKSNYDYQNNPNYFTPNFCLKYKPDDINTEAVRYNKEENRVLYVAATRAKELLILSTINFGKRGVPNILKKTKQKYRGVEKLELENLNLLQKVKSKTKKNKIEILPLLKLEEIMEDYLFCQIKYKLKSLNYKAPNNNEKFIDLLMHKILISIYSPEREEKPSKQDVKNIILATLKSYSISQSKMFSNDFKPILNILEFWKKYGEQYDVNENNISITKRFKNCDLNANLDLIIKENEDEISIVKFTTSSETIKDYIDFYKDCLNYYGIFLKGIEEYHDKKIKNIILHTLNDNQKHVIEYNETQAEISADIIDNLIKDIIEGKFVKNETKCSLCGYKEHACK